MISNYLTFGLIVDGLKWCWDLSSKQFMPRIIFRSVFSVRCSVFGVQCSVFSVCAGCYFQVSSGLLVDTQQAYPVLAVPSVWLLSRQVNVQIIELCPSTTVENQINFLMI